jgi:hypothetical protein
MLYYAKPNAIAAIQDQHLDLQEFSRFIKTFLKARGVDRPWRRWFGYHRGDPDTLGGIPHDSTPKKHQKGPVEE